MTLVGTPVVYLSASDLPAFCPNPSMPLWASHPRIFLDVVNESEAMCPYCGTRYRLKRDTHVRAHEFDTRELHQDRHQLYAAQATIDPQTPDGLAHSRESPGVAVDALGNTTLEQMTRWLKRQR
ncbi:zinc-finger domain protein [mine drainage metagenome]|uniref:Zinc-finger domain protein n=1 Tax=mine drainage metagenome TaxID=410659 RepID=A0A1J5RDL3_9ZZZZ